eukprot:9167166-Pyramimonas_sp.AAC.1
MNTARSPAKGDAPSDPKGAVEHWMNRVDIDDILRTGAKLGKDIFQPTAPPPCQGCRYEASWMFDGIWHGALEGLLTLGGKFVVFRGRMGPLGVSSRPLGGCLGASVRLLGASWDLGATWEYSE